MVQSKEIRITNFLTVPSRSVILLGLDIYTIQHFMKIALFNPTTIVPAIHSYINVEKANMTNVKYDNSTYRSS
jgi:hypothetical protein